MSDESKPAEALDFVYCGRRWNGSKLFIVVRPIRGGKLEDELAYAFNRKAHRAIGGVYSGAKFNDTSIIGLAAALQYVRRWDDKAQLIDWESRDHHAESEARQKKIEADDKKVSEVEKIMLPLRVQFEGYRMKRDLAGMDALRAAVLAALSSSPRVIETD